jgi:hypothetical protein
MLRKNSMLTIQTWRSIRNACSTSSNPGTPVQPPAKQNRQKACQGAELQAKQHHWAFLATKTTVHLCPPSRADPHTQSMPHYITLHKSGQACACPLGSWPLPCIQRKVKDRVPHGLVRVQTHTTFTKCKGNEFVKGSCFLSTAIILLE